MQVSKGVLAMYAVATEESGAYALNGVLMDRSGSTCRVRVTDGRVLIDVTWPSDDAEGNFPETILPRALVEHAAEHLGSVDVSRDGGAVAVRGVTDDATVMRLGAAVIDGRFPKTDGVIPNYGPDEAVTIGVDPSRLAEIARILAELLGPHRPEYKGMLLAIPMNPRKPLVLEVKTPDGLVARAALMPVQM
jgi:hypothetical protein